MYSGEASFRLFTALWPADDVVGRLLDVTRQWHWPADARITRPERLHLTLHFIGNVPVARIAQLQTELAVPFEPFDWELARAQVWHGGIAVLEPQDTPPALARLHASLQVRLAALALPIEERPYRPHVTLARKAFGARPPPHFAPVRWRADSGYRLVRSLPGGRGYEPLAGFA